MTSARITNCLLPAVLLLVSVARVDADEASLIDSMEGLPQATGEKVKVQLVEGKEGRAVEIRFDDGCQNAYAQTRSRANSAWDQADGFSFWVKGDGSDHLGGMELIWNEDYALRYAFAFPINHTDWRKVVIRWRDLIPETANSAALPIEPRRGNAPSKLGSIWFGKWWYWRDYAAHSYTIDSIQLEMSLPDDEPHQPPTGEPLGRVKKKLSRKEPIKVVLMGDSLA